MTAETPGGGGLGPFSWCWEEGRPDERSEGRMGASLKHKQAIAAADTKAGPFKALARAITQPD